MNDDPKHQHGTTIDRRPVLFGFASGITPAILAALPFNNQASAILMIFGMTIWPLVAVVASIKSSSRRFGLGMLLGVGLGWLVMLAVCGGLLK